LNKKTKLSLTTFSKIYGISPMKKQLVSILLLGAIRGTGLAFDF